ncbi:MAG: hypothetical protein ACKVP0_03010 [Pirellulaceae bacterium]
MFRPLNCAALRALSRKIDLQVPALALIGVMASLSPSSATASELTGQSADSLDCQESSRETFDAYAPPAGVWGKHVVVANHLGAVTIKVTAKPVSGATLVIGEIEYFADAKDAKPTRKEFRGSITVRTGEAVGSVKVRLKGIPTGTVVTLVVE